MFAREWKCVKTAYRSFLKKKFAKKIYIYNFVRTEALSATTMIHQWPLPFALDGLREKADAKPRKALTEDIRKDLRDSAVDNVALIHQSLKTSTLLCPIWRLSSCNPSAGYFGGSSGRKVGRSSITRGENSQASLQIWQVLLLADRQMAEVTLEIPM